MWLWWVCMGVGGLVCVGDVLCCVFGMWRKGDGLEWVGGVSF